MRRNNIDALANECKINLDKSYIKPEMSISFSVGPKEILIGGRGDLSVVTGKPKTRKSFLMGLMAASAMTHNHKLASNGQRKALYFDTEQSEYHAAQSLRLSLIHI